MNDTQLRKLEEAVNGAQIHPTEAVTRGLEQFHALVAERDELRKQVIRMDRELEIRMFDLNVALRERDHYRAYAQTLTTQLNGVRNAIEDAIEYARAHPMESKQSATNPSAADPPEKV